MFQRRVAIDEHRQRAAVHDRRDGSDERQRRDGHLIPRPDAKRVERQLQRGGARRHGNRVARADRFSKLHLESIDERANRRNPVRLHRLQEQLRLFRSEVRGREQNLSGHQTCIPADGVGPAIGRAGTPATVTPSGTFEVTTAPAPTMHRAPIEIPGITTAPAPTSVSSPIRTLPARMAPGAM